MFLDYNRRMGVLITPMALTHRLHPIKCKSRNKRRNLWVGWCVSSWRSLFWPVHSIYYIHTSKRHTSQTLVWPCWCIGWFDTVWFQVRFQMYGPLFSMSLYGSKYHVTVYIGQQHPITVYRTFLVCVVLVLNVIRCSCHYFLGRILFHHDFHHDSCDYHLDLMAINYLLIYALGFLYLRSSGSADTQLPGCFRPWTFFLNIGFNMFPLDSFMSCLHSLLGYSTG